jgi:hypothetical protein
MKRTKISIKKQIEKKIEFRNKDVRFLDSRGHKKMDDLEALKKNPPVGSNFTRDQLRLTERTGIDLNKTHYYPIKDYGQYIKPEIVDCDVIIYVSSYDRYEKLMKILSQLYTQKTIYSFKIIVMNDGSTDKRYKNIKMVFPSTTVLTNKINGGKAFYWRTINRIFQTIKLFNTYAVIQIDDDFVLCNNFINKLMNEFFKLKEKNNSYMGIRYHIPIYKKNEVIDDTLFDVAKNCFDGGSLFDIQFLKLIDYNINEIDPKVFKDSYQHSHVWSSLNDLVKKHGVQVYRTRESFAFHDGNEDSKMHPELRLKKKIYTGRFADDGNNI